MVIHIVNGFEREKLKFLQFIHKTEQFCGSVLPRKNQIWRGPRRRPVENATERLLGNLGAEETSGIASNAFPIIG